MAQLGWVLIRHGKCLSIDYCSNLNCIQLPSYYYSRRQNLSLKYWFSLQSCNLNIFNSDASANFLHSVWHRNSFLNNTTAAFIRF